MVQLSATRCSCIAILLVSPVSFAAITLCVAPQRVFVVVYVFIDSVRKLLGTPSYFIKVAGTIYSSGDNSQPVWRQWCPATKNNYIITCSYRHTLSRSKSHRKQAEWGVT
jgi:hypothetical protein